ncbi:MAG: hypothetical protein ABJ095_06640 [Nitratireductor sp.]
MFADLPKTDLRLRLIDAAQRHAALRDQPHKGQVWSGNISLPARWHSSG